MVAFAMRLKKSLLIVILFLFVLVCFIRADIIILNKGGKLNCQKVQAKEDTFICIYGESQITINKDAVKEIHSDGDVSLYKNQSAISNSDNKAYIETKRKDISTDESASSIQEDSLIKEIEIKKLESNYNLERTNEAKSKLIKAYIERVNELFEGKNFKRALDYLLKLDQIKPNDESINLRIAFCQYKLSDFFTATYYAQRSKKINSNYADAYFLLGEIYYLQGNLNDAAYEWQEGLKLENEPVYAEKLKKLKEEMKISEDFLKTNTHHFKIEFDGEGLNPSLTNEIINVLEDIYKELSLTLNYYPKEPTEVIFYTSKDYKIVRGGPDWSAGFYDGKIRIPAKGINFNEYLIPLLRHELTHALLSQKTNNNAPGWLQEGLANYFEGEKIQNDKVLLELPSIKNLSGSFSSFSAEEAKLVYAKSLSFVNFLIEQYGMWKILMLLDNLSEEPDIEKAFFSAYSEDLLKVEEEWGKRVGR